MFALSDSDLPKELTPARAVEGAYPRELADLADHLRRGNSCLVECDKDLAPFVFLCVRDRLRAAGLACNLIDGRPVAETRPPSASLGLAGAMMTQLREAVRGATEQRVLVLPHLDVLTDRAITAAADSREVVPLLHENPNIVCLGFRDPGQPLPRAVEALFPQRVPMLGVRRDRMPHVVTGPEGRKFGKPINLARVHARVSGLNAARLRRVLACLDGEDHPADPARAMEQLRHATLTGGLAVPATGLTDIGGYAAVKARLDEDVFAVLRARERAGDEAELARMDELLPRGVLFSGPGTGKRLFAEALAGEIGAALLATSGAELKSKTFGGSEENLRLVFYRARQAAPAVILFDDIDSFASNRAAADTVSAIEQSMYQQLLAEFDRLPREELVFVAATTNHPERLDRALFRPGRFELHLPIPLPDDDDRREIFHLYNERLGLALAPDALAHAVERTPRASAAHLAAVARALARYRLRANRTDASRPDDIDRALALAGMEI